MAISFFTEDVSFNLPGKLTYKRWLKKCALHFGNQQVSALNYIFCSDEYLHKINLEYLNHDTYTDIITFDQGEPNQPIEGEIYISIDRVKENATAHNDTFVNEVTRVIAHGLLHLCGYKDKSTADAEKMRAAENEAITMFHVEQLAG